MRINVRYKPDLPETIRLNLYLQRKSAWRYAAGGVLALTVGAAGLWPAYMWLYTFGGIVLIFEIPVLVLVRVYRHRELLRQETELTVTSEGIQRRTEAYTLRVAWDVVERVDERKNGWIVITKKPTAVISLGKRRLSQEQQAELAAFIAARHLDKQARKGMTPAQEAGYALANGVARSDLTPEVQAEYDKLVAERDPA